MIVLANRPGFPFLGNDFFASLGKLVILRIAYNARSQIFMMVAGDIFSCHAVNNPDLQSEKVHKCLQKVLYVRRPSSIVQVGTRVSVYRE